MFATKTPQDFYNTITETISALPKTADEVKDVMIKMQNVYTAEAKKAVEVMKVYQKASTGDATVNEIADANKKAQSLATAARFAAIMSVPGAIFMIPTLKKLESEFVSVEIIPESVKQEFDI